MKIEDVKEGMIVKYVGILELTTNTEESYKAMRVLSRNKPLNLVTVWTLNSKKVFISEDLEEYECECEYEISACEACTMNCGEDYCELLDDEWECECDSLIEEDKEDYSEYLEKQAAFLKEFYDCDDEYDDEDDNNNNNNILNNRCLKKMVVMIEKDKVIRIYELELKGDITGMEINKDKMTINTEEEYGDDN